ncbi:hypothetical protein EVAR_97783_1 [Eumeta japonica]|uniref:Uncharacterized protein n=1 Tax=Eumeta variegata TaxID=151549 RepID=A0A4C2A508_EUMVA|nr:hypothetical protein EVAR_97783_1 [Eumeta japonica]
MSDLSRKDCGSSDSGSETRNDGDTEIDADICKRFLRTYEILDDPKSNKEKLDSCVHVLGKVITEVRDQRCTSNNTGNSGEEGAICAEVDYPLKT